MTRPVITTIAVAIGLAFGNAAMARNMSMHEYKSTLTRIDSEHRSDLKNCRSLSGNANDICVAEANGKAKVATADLEATRKNTRQAHYNARVIKAEADYAVAKERCDDKAGNDNDVCLKEAKAAEVAAEADAKAQMKTSQAYGEASEKSNDARKEARETAGDAQRDAAVEKRDADYAVAKEKCDSLAGDTKSQCVDNAKRHYGQM